MFEELHHRTYVYITTYRIILPPWEKINYPPLDNVYINQYILNTVNIENTLLTPKIPEILLGIGNLRTDLEPLSRCMARPHVKTTENLYDTTAVVAYRFSGVLTKVRNNEE